MTDAIYCEVCRLPHRRGVTLCEDCGHYLGSTPDWQGLRDELPPLRTKIVVGVAALVAMIAVNIFLFGGAGYVIALAPLGWIASSAYRHHVLSTHLKNAEPKQDDDRNPDGGAPR